MTDSSCNHHFVVEHHAEHIARQTTCNCQLLEFHVCNNVDRHINPTARRFRSVSVGRTCVVAVQLSTRAITHTGNK